VIRVLLSTYNGARYLPELLDSVLSQDAPGVTLLVRDDGSTDGTRDILADYAARYASIRVMLGENIGVVRSYFALLSEPTGDDELVAFCDQDDVWQRDKLSRALAWLRDVSEPTMYCSRVQVVDDQLDTRSFTPIVRAPAFANALVENIATGCTIVLNSKARALVLRTLPATPNRVLMHDWWLYLVMSGLGKVIVDPEARILYRQHLSNVVGAASGLPRLQMRIRRFVAGDSGSKMRAQATELQECCGNLLTARHRRTLERFLAGRTRISSRLRYALTADVWRQGRVDSLLLRALVLLGRA
jgi:glycosyltransferase involved in cell wall biosynthesis